MNLILLKQSEIQSITSSSSSQTEQQYQQHVVVHLTSKDERAKHISNHLNKKSGETVSIGIIDGSKGKAIVQHQNGGGIRLEIQSDTLLFVPLDDEPEITLILAVPFPMRIKALWPVMSSFSAVTRIVIVKGKKRVCAVLFYIIDDDHN